MTANLHYTKVKGNQILYDGSNAKVGWIDAWGPDVRKDIIEFTAEGHASGELGEKWVVTRVEAGAGESTAAVTDFVGGALLLTTDAAENDGLNVQRVAECYELTADQHLFFEARGIQINDATQTDFFIGLAVRDTAILGGVTDRIGFECLDGAVDIKCMVEKDSTETLTDTGIDLADATDVRLGFYWDGDAGTVEFFVNGTSVATPATTNLPNDEILALSIEFLTGEAVANTMRIQRIAVIQVGL